MAVIPLPTVPPTALNDHPFGAVASMTPPERLIGLTGSGTMRVAVPVGTASREPYFSSMSSAMTIKAPVFRPANAFTARWNMFDMFKAPVSRPANVHRSVNLEPPGLSLNGYGCSDAVLMTVVLVVMLMLRVVMVVVMVADVGGHGGHGRDGCVSPEKERGSQAPRLRELLIAPTSGLQELLIAPMMTVMVTVMVISVSATRRLCLLRCAALDSLHKIQSIIALR